MDRTTEPNCLIKRLVIGQKEHFQHLLRLSRYVALWEHVPHQLDPFLMDQKNRKGDPHLRAVCCCPNVGRLDHLRVCLCVVLQDWTVSHMILFPALRGFEDWNQGSPYKLHDQLGASSSVKQATLTRLSDRWRCGHSTTEDSNSLR
jgi:hypothetical protein